jgi:hypothetical protein
MIRNIQGHRIRWRVLAAQGALVGLWSSLAMLVVAMVTTPMFESTMDTWSFTKVIASGVMGDGAASPISGFEWAPVLVGAAIHLGIGTIIGIAFAALVGLCDLEGWTSVSLVGLLFGAVLFVAAAAVVSVGMGPWNSLPLAPLLWGNIAFGLVAGVSMASWAQDADLDLPEGERAHVFESSFEEPDRPLPTYR